MRVAALYDIHANAPALEAVLNEVRSTGADLIFIGGDVVPGPMPCETIALIRSLKIPVDCISGNGDRVVMMASRGEEPTEVPAQFRETVYWNAQQLAVADAEWISTWPKVQAMPIEPLNVFFCHASPRNDTDIFTEDTDAAVLESLFKGVQADLIVCGHTHMRFDRMIGRKRLVNAGSVGMSFEGTGAYWLLLDGKGVELRRTSYDLERAAQQIRASGYPQADYFATQNVLTTPTKETMLQAFSHMPLK